MAILVFIRLHPLLGSLVMSLNENWKCGPENSTAKDIDRSEEIIAMPSHV